MPTPEDGNRYLDWRYPYKRPDDLKIAAEIIVGISNLNGTLLQSRVLGFEINNRVGYLNLNKESYMPNNGWHGTIGINALRMSFLETFKDEIDSLVITYNGIDPTVENTVKPNTTVFNTENISSITFYSYSGNGVGSTVEDKYMAEIINWLKTFTVGERYPDEPLDGDGHIVIEITYADGTVIKDTMDTVLVNGVVYYTDHGGYPDCYWEILSRTKLEPEYKTTEEKTNYALEKTYTLSGETVDADYAKYCYLGEYSGDYTWCDYDLNKMTDGVVGDITAADYASDPFGVPGVTVMFAGTNRLFEYIIDLGDHYEDINSFVFRNVRIGGNRGFKVRLAYVSDDNVNFTKVTGTTTEAKINTTNDEYFDCTYKLDTPAKGRYVRILLNLQNCYVLQLEELEIWNK
ncbi:MAG: discoidin domain-containing protein, partial [Clostridia bacterium]|nr:discoidin domain-containing protein [Clostridia bacterium]